MKGREGEAQQHLEQRMTPSPFGSLGMSSEKRMRLIGAQKLQVHSGVPATPGFQGLQPTFRALPCCVSSHTVDTERSMLLIPRHASHFQPLGLCTPPFHLGSLSPTPSSFGAPLMGFLLYGGG